MRRIALGWLPPILWMGIIFYFSSRPDLPTVGEQLDQYLVSKTAHLLEYALLAILSFRAWHRSLARPAPLPKAFYLALVLVVLFAVSDEFHQSFTPNRHPSPIDVGIDALGASIGLLAVRFSLRRGIFGVKLLL